ncbi:DUF5683 domain-containing protein [Mariniflexile sp. AS56]|uniref:DUF5683 domain-containing protein n=1 Tax=Mariniflexile sp. AS56 TaxID=3063957 RepID=UPI0026ECB90E|nr:DUF5683 domain-containing protein [Mariniflexile sp. AS56]MDO7171775.1 DUF5683 domain-containing protein [Mariniflexile sp. AS56]
MPNKLFTATLFSLLFCCFVTAQDKNKKKELPEGLIIDSIITVKKPYNPLSPAKAAFYSAVLPGLGQAYNKSYWKIPIVYGGLATGIYFYSTNNKEYNRYRDAYKSRLAGLTTDEFYFDTEGNQLSTPRVTTDGLERGQDFYRKNKEISLLVTIGIYALNIIDANVDAHLMQYNVDENLSLAPHFRINEIDATSNLGLTLNFKF